MVRSSAAAVGGVGAGWEDGDIDVEAGASGEVVEARGGLGGGGVGVEGHDEAVNVNDRAGRPTASAPAG